MICKYMTVDMSVHVVIIETGDVTARTANVTSSVY